MQFDLEAFTDVAQFVIFDPEVIEARGDQGRDDFERLIDDATAKGDAIAYSYAGDGEARFRVLVGEKPPEAWLQRKDCSVEGAMLRVPSGRIMAAGAEYVWPEVQPKHATVAEIPPGDYLVDAFDVEWEDEKVGEEIAKECPGAVIWLRPITDEQSFNPGKFGLAYVESSLTETDDQKTSVLGGIGIAIAFLFFCFVIALIISLVILCVS